MAKEMILIVKDEEENLAHLSALGAETKIVKTIRAEFPEAEQVVLQVVNDEQLSIKVAGQECPEPLKAEIAKFYLEALTE